MGLRLFFLPNLPGATFIQGATFRPDSRVAFKLSNNSKIVFTETKEMRITHLRMQNPIPQGVWNSSCHPERTAKEIQIILRLFLVIAMYCRASSIQANLKMGMSWNL